MAPLDSEQISQVKEFIREGTNEAFASSQHELLREKAAIEKTQSDIVETTEKAVLTQQGLAQELERKILAINGEMESRFTVLRQELFKEFASTRDNMQTMSTGFATAETNLRELLESAESHKTALAASVASQFQEYEARVKR